MWKDTSSYSRDSKERIPTTWEFDNPRIVVTRYHHGDKDTWYFTFSQLRIDLKPLKEKEIEKAKKEAIEFVKKELKTMLALLGD